MDAILMTLRKRYSRDVFHKAKARSSHARSLRGSGAMFEPLVPDEV